MTFPDRWQIAGIACGALVVQLLTLGSEAALWERAFIVGMSILSGWVLTWIFLELHTWSRQLISVRVSLNGTTIRAWMVGERYPRIAKLIQWACKPFDGDSTPMAITVGHQVLVLIKKSNDCLLWHESQHARQAERFEPRWVPWPKVRMLLGGLLFQASYVKEWIFRGYRGNRYEEEAYYNSKWFSELDERLRPAVVYLVK